MSTLRETPIEPNDIGLQDFGSFPLKYNSWTESRCQKTVLELIGRYPVHVIVGATGLIGSILLEYVARSTPLDSRHILLVCSRSSVPVRRKNTIYFLGSVSDWRQLIGCIPHCMSVTCLVGSTKAHTGGGDDPEVLVEEYYTYHNLNVQIATAAKRAGVASMIIVSEFHYFRDHDTILSSYLTMIEDTIREIKALQFEHLFVVHARQDLHGARPDIGEVYSRALVRSSMNPYGRVRILDIFINFLSFLLLVKQNGLSAALVVTHVLVQVVMEPERLQMKRPFECYSTNFSIRKAQIDIICTILHLVLDSIINGDSKAIYQQMTGLTNFRLRIPLTYTVERPMKWIKNIVKGKCFSQTIERSVIYLFAFGFMIWAYLLIFLLKWFILLPSNFVLQYFEKSQNNAKKK